jgi:hypothetical protein
MMRKGIARALGVGALAAVAFAAWRAWNARTRAVTGNVEWDNAPFPFPPVPRPAPAHHVHIPPEVEPGGGPETEQPGEVATASLEPWIAPIDNACPPSHPVKAKLASGIFHVPGGMNYERTKPDRCYLDGPAAERDGLRRSKM